MKYYQGTFTPKNKEKYKGSLPVIYRSSWEFAFMKLLDEHPNVEIWGSESVVVPYVYTDDGKMHRYFIDFIVKFNNGSKYMFEIKPKNKTTKPELPKSGRKTKRYLTSLAEYVQNEAKWTAAKAYAEKNDYVFKVLTEDTLKQQFGLRLIT